MGRGIDIPAVGGQNTMGSGVKYIPWVGGKTISKFPKYLNFQKTSKF